MAFEGSFKPDVVERSKGRDGKEQSLDRRLFVQLQVFTGCRNTGSIVEAVRQSDLDGVVYRDLNDPGGIGVLFMSPEPADFVGPVRDIYGSDSFAGLKHRPEMTMLGRSYAIGHEQDLEDWLLTKPRRTALNPEWPWAVWYPLRRTGEFAVLEGQDQRDILMEHARIGFAYGKADLAHDVRLACHGIDAGDNEFVIGLIGKDLHPLSHVVQTMRKTTQTSRYIQSMGPFFVGHALFQTPSP